MKRVQRIILLLLPVFFSFNDLSFGQLGISGELRARPEYRRGYKSLASPGQDPAFFVSQRTRLKFQYDAERIGFFVSVQDIRTWGSTSQLNVSDNFLSVHEAWGEVDLSSRISLKAGRQELAYDDHRILGNVNWAQQGRSHDLLLIRFENGDFRWHTGLAFNQNAEQFSSTFYNVGGNYKTMQFLWLHSDFENLSGSILILNNGLQAGDSATSYSQTMGTHVNTGFGNLGLTFSGYFQTGKDVLKRKLSAGYFSSEISWLSGDIWTPALGLEFLSGSDQDEPGTNHSFTPLYGTNHKFNGHMDYFFVGNHVNSVGLWDPYLRIACKKGKWSCNGTLHCFVSAARILDPANTAEALPGYLGTEVDLAFSWSLAERVSLSGGYSQMFASSSMEALKGGDHGTLNNWAWLMIVFTPDLLKPAE